MRTSRWMSLGIAAAVLISVLASAGVAIATLTVQSHPMVASGWIHTVGLKKDGSVVAVGAASPPMCDVGGWRDITQIAAGQYHTVALKSDGSVVATGSNSNGECNVGSWNNIIALAPLSYGQFTVGLKSNHTVVAVGANFDGATDVSGWSNINAVAAGFIHTLGLKGDGTVVSAGDNFYGQGNVGSWTNIKAVGTGWYHSLGVKQDGSVVAAGMGDNGQCDVSGWTDVVAVAGGYYHSVGLRRDGTVVATKITGDGTDYGQCDVSGWHDIIAIATGGFTTVGLMSDGTVVATGLNGQNQTDVSSWQLADRDDNVPGVAPTRWQWTGYGSRIADKYDVYRVQLAAGVPVEFSCVRTSGDANYNIYMYGSDAWDIWHWETWLPGYQASQPGNATETITYTPTKSGTHYLLVDCDTGAGGYRVTEKCSAKLNSTAPTAVTFGKWLAISGAITSPAWYAPIAGKQVTCAYTSSAGTTRLATATVGIDGSYAFSFRPDRGGKWTVSLVSTSSLMADDVQNIAYSVVPVLTTPKAVTAPKANKYFTLTGNVAPSHAAAIKVEVRKGSRLFKYKTYSVTANASGRWSLRLKLGKGDWRIRAGHVDPDHAQGWSNYKRIKF